MVTKVILVKEMCGSKMEIVERGGGGGHKSVAYFCFNPGLQCQPAYQNVNSPCKHYSHKISCLIMGIKQ